MHNVSHRSATGARTIKHAKRKGHGRATGGIASSTPPVVKSPNTRSGSHRPIHAKNQPEPSILLPRFPQEIFDMIIGCFTGDPGRLYDVAFVSKAWAIRARFCLFNPVVLSNTRTVKSFLECLQLEAVRIDIARKLYLSPDARDRCGSNENVIDVVRRLPMLREIVVDRKDECLLDSFILSSLLPALQSKTSIKVYVDITLTHLTCDAQIIWIQTVFIPKLASAGTPPTQPIVIRLRRRGIAADDSRWTRNFIIELSSFDTPLTQPIVVRTRRCGIAADILLSFGNAELQDASDEGCPLVTVEWLD